MSFRMQINTPLPVPFFDAERSIGQELKESFRFVQNGGPECIDALVCVVQQDAGDVFSKQ